MDPNAFVKLKYVGPEGNFVFVVNGHKYYFNSAPQYQWGDVQQPDVATLMETGQFEVASDWYTYTPPKKAEAPKDKK